MTRYRITKQFSLDGQGRPETNYMVERKEGIFKPWLGVRMFVTEFGAIAHIDDLKKEAKRAR